MNQGSKLGIWAWDPGQTVSKFGLFGEVLNGSKFHFGEQTWVLSSLGTNSSMFTICSVFVMFDMFEVRFWAKNVMFGIVRRLVLLLYDQTSHGTYSLMFMNCSVFVMFDMFEVRFWAKM